MSNEHAVNPSLCLNLCDGILTCKISGESMLIWNSSMYKIQLKRFVDSANSSNQNIQFKVHLTYPYYKRIIEIISRDAMNRGYVFEVAKEVKDHIKDRELFINERSNVGIAIKQQLGIVFSQFNEYKATVDSQMVRKLREKQMWDSFFMWTMKRAANFSVPGSGKTSSVLGVYSILNFQNQVDRVIMIGPKNSFGSWIDEFKACFEDTKSLNELIIHDYKNLEDKKKALLFDSNDKNLILLNYESIGSLISEITELIKQRTLLVFDEVHKVKAMDGIRAQFALEIAKESQYTIALTGTPIPNSYADIYNLLHILFHDEYNEFFGFSERQLKSPTTDDVEIINSKIQPFFCRTTKKQLQVPDANEDIVVASQASDAENKIFEILLMKYAKNKLALIIRLLQLETNPKLLLNAIENNGEDFSEILDISGEIEDIDYKDYSKEILSLIASIDKTEKFMTCLSLVEALYKQGDPVIIWCIFVDSIFRLQTELESRNIRAGVIYGGTESNNRQDILNAFRNGEVDVLITNPHTLAESVSLHSVCHNAVYYEYSFNLVHLLQSKDRIHRLGLPKNQYTQYYFVQNHYNHKNDGEYSLDQRIYERLLEKEDIMLDAIENNVLEQLTSVDDDIEFIFKNLLFN